MASRVNVRFVVTLSTVLGLVFVIVVFIAWSVVTKSASELARQGDEAMREGKYGLAEFIYSKAVNKDPTNLEYLDKWQDALLHMQPESRTHYRSQYQKYRDLILPARAMLLRTDVAAHDDSLRALYREISLIPFERAAWDALISRTEEALRYFDVASGVDPRWPMLRKYRGIALVNILRNELELTPSQVVQAREDLEAALAADPHDPDTAVHLVQWHLIMARRAASAREPARASEHRASAGRVVAAFLADNPDDPTVTTTALQLEIEHALESAPATGGPSEQLAARLAALRALAPAMERTGQVLLRADPASLDFRVILQFAALAGRIDPARGRELSTALLDQAIQARPDDPDLMYVKARLAEADRDFAGAMQWYLRITGLAEKPVSLEGYRLHQRKAEAWYMLARSAILLFEQTSDPSRRAELLDEARRYRDALADAVPERSPPVLLTDARLAVASGELSRAQALLREYNAQTNESVPDGLHLGAQVAYALNEPGTARRLWTRLIRLDPNNVPARIRLAALEENLQNISLAMDLYREVLEISPDEDVARERLAYLEILTNQRQTDDPVVRALAHAQALANGSVTRLPDPEAAIERLIRGLAETDHDPRIIRAMVQLAQIVGGLEQTLPYIQAARERHPDNAELAALERMVAAETSLEAKLALIDQTEGREIDKLWWRYLAYQQFGQSEQASQTLATLAQRAPEDPRVLGALFDAAVERNDLNEAARLAQVAQRTNADLADGLGFRGRLELAQGRYEEAVVTLQQAVQRGTTDVRTLRLLAETNLRLNRLPQALAAYRQAMDINPADVRTIYGYVRTLATAGQPEEALAVARTAESRARGEPRFFDLLLRLEGDVGDKALAAQRREQLAQRVPGNVENRLALAGLYIDLHRWADARRLLDQLAREIDTLALAELNARWHADQGDLSRAREAFVSFLERNEEAASQPEPYLAFGRFLILRGATDEGLAALERARAYQDPAVREADRVLGDTLLRLGRMDEALAVYTSMVEAGAQQLEHEIDKRIIEIKLRLGRIDEAEAAIARLGEAVGSDLQLMLLRADAALAAGRTQDAYQLLDRAVAQFPEEPLCLVKRAAAKYNDPALRGDVLPDLTAALRLRPTYVPALRMRAHVMFEQGRVDEALADLRRVVEANPSLDEIRLLLVNELIRRRRDGEALDVARRALEQRPGDAELAVTLGDVFAASGLMSRALPLYEAAWTKRKDVGTTRRYTESLLMQTPPRLGDAEQALRTAGLPVDEHPELRMIRARVRAGGGQLPAALADASAAYAQVADNWLRLVAWFRDLREVLRTNRELLQFLQQLSRERGPSDWLAYFGAVVMLEEPGTREQGQRVLEQLMDSAQPALRLNASKRLSNAMYAAGAYERAAELMRVGLEVAPDDVDLNNNLAFTLAAHLNQPGEALPYAERAAAAAPRNANVLDTLGLVYQANGRLEDARRTLRGALAVDATSADRATILLRLARVELSAGNRETAQDYAQQVRDLLRRDPSLEASHKQALDEVLRELD